MIHGGQFVISKNAIELENYASVEMQDGWILSYHKKLSVVKGGKNNEIWLIGHAWSVGKNHKSPREVIENYNDDNPKKILEEEPYWCGQFVLVIGQQLFTDAAGLLSVFYSVSQDKEGGTVSVEAISSDPYFIHHGHPRAKEITHAVYPNTIMRYMPGKYTFWKDVFRLAPSEILNLDRKNNIKDVTESRTLLTPISDSTPNKIIDVFIEDFCNGLQNMTKEFNGVKFLIPLTGGYDSRTVFALAKHSGIPFQCFTLEHDNMPICDILYPREICSRTQVPYMYQLRNAGYKSLQREEEYVEHQNHAQLEQDRTFYEYKQYEQLVQSNGPIALIRGHLWEIPQEYATKYIQNTMNCDTAWQSLCDHFELPHSSRPANSIYNSLVRMMIQDKQDIPISARYYWELESGCWHADNEHGFGIYDDVYSVQPLNSRFLLSLLIQLPENMRVSKEFQVTITKRLCPEISDIPYGKNTDIKITKFGRFYKNVKKGCGRMKRIGVRRTIDLYRRNITFERKKKAGEKI